MAWIIRNGARMAGLRGLCNGKNVPTDGKTLPPTERHYDRHKGIVTGLKGFHSHKVIHAAGQDFATVKRGLRRGKSFFPAQTSFRQEKTSFVTYVTLDSPTRDRTSLAALRHS
jgi:hypothetical protein